MDYFVGLGYKRGKSIVAAPYDFRFAPHSQEYPSIVNKTMMNTD